MTAVTDTEREAGSMARSQEKPRSSARGCAPVALVATIMIRQQANAAIPAKRRFITIR